MLSIKEEIAALLERLPADATVEDIQYHIYVFDKVRKGLDSIEQDATLTQEQVEERLLKRFG